MIINARQIPTRLLMSPRTVSRQKHSRLKKCRTWNNRMFVKEGHDWEQSSSQAVLQKPSTTAFIWYRYTCSASTLAKCLLCEHTDRRFQFDSFQTIIDKCKHIMYPIHNAMSESAPLQAVGKLTSDGVACNRATSSAVKASSNVHTYNINTGLCRV